MFASACVRIKYLVTKNIANLLVGKKYLVTKIKFTFNFGSFEIVNIEILLH